MLDSNSGLIRLFPLFEAEKTIQNALNLIKHDWTDFYNEGSEVSSGAKHSPFAYMAEMAVFVIWNQIYAPPPKKTHFSQKTICNLNII